MSIENLQEIFNINTNFLEYGGFILTIKNYMDNLEKPTENLTRPVNSLLNIVLNKDTSGVSNLYKSIHLENSTIIPNICSKWYNKSGIILLPHDIKRSFTVTNKQIDVTYLRYTQFRTLHYRYYTNDLLVKCKIQADDTCSICHIAKDSNYHMLLECTSTQNLWLAVENWIRQICHNDYNLSDRRKIIGDLENNDSINIIILNTKKVLYLSKLDKKEPHISHVQSNVRKVYNHDLYKYSINNKQVLFERKWSLLLDFFQYNH